MSEDNNLSSFQDTNGKADLFLFDSSTNVTFRVSRGFDGLQTNADPSNPSVSELGRHIAFATDATSPEDTNNERYIYIYLLSYER